MRSADNPRLSRVLHTKPAHTTAAAVVKPTPRRLKLSEKKVIMDATPREKQPIRFAWKQDIAMLIGQSETIRRSAAESVEEPRSVNSTVSHTRQIRSMRPLHVRGSIGRTSHPTKDVGTKQGSRSCTQESSTLRIRAREETDHWARALSSATCRRVCR